MGTFFLRHNNVRLVPVLAERVEVKSVAVHALVGIMSNLILHVVTLALH